MTPAPERPILAGGGRVSWPEWVMLGLLGPVGLVLLWTTATVALDPEHQAALAGGTMLLFLLCNRVAGRPMTLFLMVLSAAMSLRYILWRFTETLEFTTTLQWLLGAGLATAELYAILVLALGYMQMIWPLERKPVPLPDDPAQWPTVDVYIPTYNEDLSVVRATVLAAMNMDWPREKMQVWILDDGRRRDFRDFAEECGCGYIIRPDNSHAKAGNLNHAMRLTDGAFIAIFDCDHVPTRAFLQLTMGWMLRDPGLALIQTPHYFYSPDPFQRNLAAGTRVPAESNLFYGIIQDGNDFWDATFFCGSCAVMRRAALDSVGGVAVETVTEDAHTALKMHRRGWRSAYLRIPLAAGLATERLILHIGQRMRWARGNLQILRIDNPLFGPGLSLGQRLCYFSATIHWLFALPRLVFLTAPLAFLLLGQSIIAASPLAIVAYALPHIFHSVATSARIQGRWRHSYWSEIYETVLALFLVRVTLQTLLSPRKGKFNVTDKGGLLGSGYFDMRAVYPNLLLALVLAAGLARGLWGLLFGHPDTLAFQALLLNSIWVSFSLVVVMAALAVGRETRQIRRNARVRARLPVTLLLPDGRAAQGHSYNLSLSGGAMRMDMVDDVPAGTPVDLEFSVGAERILIPATAQRWDNQTLQVFWRIDDIAVESRIVQVVFGRADAWLEWDRYEKDRPLLSLWRVLVSIRGLFRPRGQFLAPSDPPPPPPALARSGAGGTLSRQSYMLPPRGRPALRRAITVALLVALPSVARAQPQPPVTAPVIRPYAAPVPALPSPFPAAPPPVAATALPPLGPDMRRVVLSLHDLGVEQPMMMRGTSALQGVLFGIRGDEVVTDARLSLAGATSPALVPEQSAITVTLNEQYVGTIQPDRDRPQFGPVEMVVNPVFFQDRNRLNFRFAGRTAAPCDDPLSGLLWAIVSDRATLTLTLARLPAQRDLARLPLPFFDRNLRTKLVLPFVVAEGASNETLQAAAIVASWLGVLADYRGTSFPVGTEAPAEGNAILVTTPRDANGQGGGLALPPLNGPTLALLPNPNDPLGTLLVVAGRTGAETMAAASALALGGPFLGGSIATVQPPATAPRLPFDAPRWLPTDRPVRFGELVEATELQGTGYAPGTFRVPFRVPPDLYTWRRRPFRADIAFRAPPGPVVDLAVSRLDVSINGLYLRSFPLASRAGPWDWGLRQLGFGVPQLGGIAAIPPWMVFGSNQLELSFDARPLRRGECVAIPDELRLAVDADSTLDLSNAYHFASLPDLAAFAGAGFPFTRMADLAETVVILPDQPGTVEVSAFLGLMGRMGTVTGLPALRLSVLRPAGAAAVAGKDVLMLGTLSHMAAAAGMLQASPFRLDGGSLQVTLPDALPGLRRLFGDPTGDARRAAATALATPLGSGKAVMLGAAAPAGGGRSLVALLAGEPQGVDAMVQALADPRMLAGIQGDLSLLSAGQVTSWRAGPGYTVGELPPWLWPDWLLRDSPAWLLGLTLAAAAVLSFVLLRVLLWSAARRLRRRAG
ncbi:Cellulose synthase catalytic subunit [UDP-forming] / Cyclic di-GMP-binding domain [Rhodovastum atsumiense]|uniref:Cellulose synthase catalytic subunit [UDP-forming] n=1 Tax=Rhodovastum atsumiense TaxID=504468 RepID=A0A5M6J285_9PROT|nr:UDP-forming cellulose synthase catalytic subunit [Rhodovastum atsumiense]KAA5614702.1 UDP-forming cellulose synthase catalytic subunit [Rhodovastum atsumiense]CAH2599764.1 Cellulose synthase catalytic subunit [UDP-forming] / Cyclic di-GMP-binding domain [Rhodovastum atsumiense]